MKKTFKEKVFDVVIAIPKGKTLSYGEVAKLAGSPNAYRAVGTIMSTHNRKDVPCHRVIKSDGTLGGYSGKGKKEDLLKAEGVKLN